VASHDFLENDRERSEYQNFTFCICILNCFTMSQKFFSQKRVKLIVTLAVCGLLIFFNPKGFFTPVRWVFSRVSYPFQKTFYLLSGEIRSGADFLGSISELKNENKNLIKENDRLSFEITLLKDEKNENEKLRDQLKLAPREKFQLEASFVIGQDLQRSESWLLIDKGANAGIKTGMPVIVSDGILVGKISEVYSNTAKVILLTDSGSVINAVDVETEAKGVIQGEYGLGTIFDLVAQTDIINKDDTIATSGLGGDFPRGLLIGKVQDTRLTADKLFQQAIVLPRVKYSKLDVVFVIKN